MLLLTAVMCALLGYQVSMPAVDNAKYSFGVYENRVIRMNTQNGKFEVCDSNLKCEPARQGQ